ALIFAGKGNSSSELIAPDQSSVVSTPVDTTAVTAVNTAVNRNTANSTAGTSDYAEATVSPEGYFSFFAMGNTAGTMQQQAPEYVEPVTEPQMTAEEVPEPVAEYQGQATEYEEPVTEYQETVSEYEEPVAEYQETVSEYEEPVTEYQETVSEYEEPVTEYQETVSEYEEPVTEYQETVSEYEEPVTEYQETVSEYEEPVAEYQETVSEYEPPVEEFVEQGAEYAEPVYEEYTEPEYDNTAQNVGSQYASDESAAESYDNGTKASYGSAAHALGFSFSNEFFEDTDVKTTAPVYEGIAAGTAIEQEMEEPEFDIFGNEIPYEETIQQTITDDAHKPYYASEDEDIVAPQVPAYKFAGNYDSDVDEFSFGESMPDMFEFEGSTPAAESPVRKKKVVKKVVRRVVRKVQPQADVQEQQSVNINAEFLQDKELMDIASGYENAALDISSYDEDDTDGMPSLIKENLHELVQANVPVPDMESNINKIISAEADARYNYDVDSDGDDDGSSSRYIIEI
ncbi:MAG: hypothetical protein IKP31_06415, partial [Lachnospiraceae bacterium]|nr:hypothetical protein [Lachnospiraceae bacterium]